MPLDDDTLAAWNARMGQAGLTLPQNPQQPPPTQPAPGFNPGAFGPVINTGDEAKPAAAPAANGALPASLPSPEDFSDLIDQGHKEHAKKAYEELSKRYGTAPPEQAPPLQAAGGKPVMFQPPAAQRQPGMIPLGGPAAGGPAKPPAAVGEMNAAFGAQRAAQEDVNRAQAEANDRAANANLGYQGTQARLAQEQQEAEERRSSAWKEQQDEYDAMRKEANSGKLDYGRWMGDPGRRFGAAIAAALGAAGAALTHTNNSALEIINGQIDRDVQQQKDELAKKREGVREKANDLGRLRERFGDERTAEAALRAQRLELAKVGLESEIQQSQSPIQQAQGKLTLAAIDQEQAKFHMAITPKPGAGSDPRKQIQELTQKIYLDSKGAMSPEDAQRQAIKLVMGQDVRPGEAGPAGWGQGGKGAIAQQAVNAVGAAPAPPSTNFLQHPINAVTNRLGIAGTEGKEAGNKQADANAAFIKAAVAQGVMSSRSAMNIDPAKPPPAMRGLIIGPNDTDKEIAEKRVRQREWLGAAGPGLPQQPLDLEDTD